MNTFTHNGIYYFITYLHKIINSVSIKRGIWRQKIYFRGENNTKSTLDELAKNFSLSEATDIVVSGGSAGGLATFHWANYIQKVFPHSHTVAIPDSGFFLDYIDVQTNTSFYRYGIYNLM